MGLASGRVELILEELQYVVGEEKEVSTSAQVELI